MRYLLALALLLPASAHAQNGLYQPLKAAPVNLNTVRPSADMTGREAFPMLYIDEATFRDALPTVQEYPYLPWIQAKACFEKTAGVVVELDPPELRVVPAVARTIRVEDQTVDSLDYAADSAHVGEHFSAPTIAYTLVASGAVLIVDRYQANIPVLRHEALHWIVWKMRKILGHPPEFFLPCDQYYEDTH